MFLIKKLIFKFMELGLGLRTCFSLDTKDPIFVNFKLSDEEAERVKKVLPPAFHLRKLRFVESDEEAAYWLSYNLYEIKYPKKELQHIKKVRCEINTFVEDKEGRKGVYVFSGSPYVSREEKKSIIGFICDMAERMVVFIYGCGRLIKLAYGITDHSVLIDFKVPGNSMRLEQPLGIPSHEEKLSSDYWRFNDISFFNNAKTFDLVNVNNAFFSATLQKIEGTQIHTFAMESPFVNRRPDVIYFHRGEISYMVNSMNSYRALPA